MNRFLDLNDLRVFAYVASLRSFSSAAQALRIHKSSASRSVARLEVLLGTPLLQRTSRKVTLTQQGLALNRQCQELLSRIDDAIGLDVVQGAGPPPWRRGLSEARRARPAASCSAAPDTSA